MDSRRELIVRVFPDGAEICALIGPDLVEGIAGFGTTPGDALRSLAEQVDKENQKTRKFAA